MAAERLAMRSVKKLFELRYQVGLSQLQTAKALGVGRATVQRYEKLVREKGLQGPDLCTLSESELSLRLGLCLNLPLKPSGQKPQPNWPEVYKESKGIRRIKHLFSISGYQPSTDSIEVFISDEGFLLFHPLFWRLCFEVSLFRTLFLV